MRATLDNPTAADAMSIWLPMLAGIPALYVPTYFDLYHDYWRSEQAAYGAVILGMVGWLFWRQRALLLQAANAGSLVLGVASLAVGLLLYVLGRSQSVYALDIVSQIPVLLGVIYLLLGKNGIRRLWFPVVLLIFLVPVPGSMLDQLLLPLKEWVSSIVDSVLHLAGYPIARSGVVLVIDSYSLLIADACSGLNSMIALSGIGLLYVHLAGNAKRWMNVALLLSILPIAFIANIIRVMLLVLITYYQGDAAGRTFHDQAAILEIGLAFGGFFLFDYLLLRLDLFFKNGKHRRVLASHAW
jgi:exosortase B